MEGRSHLVFCETAHIGWSIESQEVNCMQQQYDFTRGTHKPKYVMVLARLGRNLSSPIIVVSRR